MVEISIDLSPHSQKLLHEFQTACRLEQQDFYPVPTALELSSFLSWFNDQLLPAQIPLQSQQKITLILLSLRTELLHDLCLAMHGEVRVAHRPKNNLSWSETLKLTLLTAAGALVKACEGFDCVATMMSIFSFSSTAIFACGIIFSMLSIVAYCGLELAKLAASFDIKLTDAPKLLDSYLRQFDEIKQIRKKITKYSILKFSEDELQQLTRIISMLEERSAGLQEASKEFERVLNDKQLSFIKSVCSMVSAALFFGGSFCAAQTVSLYFFGLIMATVTPASIPVLLFSTLIGVAALSLYWNIEFPGLQSVVAGWLGLDEAKITALCDQESLANEQNKLANLREMIEDVSALKKQQGLAVTQATETQEEQHIAIEPTSLPNTTLKASANIYSFMKSMHSEFNSRANQDKELDSVSACVNSL